MHMPLTPEANLQTVSHDASPSQGVDILDKFLSLDIGHAVHTGDTITLETSLLAYVSLRQSLFYPQLN
jgi:hypothetical protein